MMGFMCNFIPHILIVVLFGKDLDGSLPAWFNILLGVLFFLYHICDNSDGK